MQTKRNNTHEHEQQSDQIIHKLKRLCRSLVVVKWTLAAIFAFVKVLHWLLKLIGFFD
jgi:hypothetical protein